MMSGKEKLYFLLERIVDARDITPSGQSLRIHATHDLNKKYRGIELDQLFTKLEVDEKVIKVIKVGNRVKEIGSRYGLNEPDDGSYHIELLSSFNAYYAKIQEEPEYQEFTGKKPTKVINASEATTEELKIPTINEPNLVKEKLQGLYERAKETPSLKNFLLTLYEYIELFDNSPLLEPVWKAILFIANEDRKTLVELEKKAHEETEVTYKKVTDYIKKANVINAVIKDELEDYENYKSGRTISSLGLTQAMHGALTYALMTLVQHEDRKHLDFCKQFGTIDERGVITSWDFSPSYNRWQEEKNRLERLEKTKVWYSWDKIVNFYNIYKDYEKLIKEEIKGRQFFNTWGLSMLYEEIKSVMEDKPFTARGRKEYDLEEYKMHLQRVNNFTMEALTYLNEPIKVKPQQLKTDIQTPDKWYKFDEKNALLNINDKEITFKTESRKFLFLKTLVQKKKFVYYGEVAEEIDGATGIKDPKNTYYEVCRGLRNSLYKIGITDFLISDFNKAKINPQYKKLKI